MKLLILLNVFNVFNHASADVRLSPLHIQDFGLCNSIRVILKPLRYFTPINSSSPTLYPQLDFCKPSSPNFHLINPFTLTRRLDWPTLNSNELPTRDSRIFTHYYDRSCVSVVRDGIFSSAWCPPTPNCPNFSRTRISTSSLGDTYLCVPVKHPKFVVDHSPWRPVGIMANNDRFVSVPVNTDLMIDRILYKIAYNQQLKVSNFVVVMCNNTGAQFSDVHCYFVSRFCYSHLAPLNSLPENFRVSSNGDYITVTHFPESSNCIHSPIFLYNDLFHPTRSLPILRMIPHVVTIEPDPLQHPSGPLFSYVNSTPPSQRQFMQLDQFFGTDCSFEQWAAGPSYCGIRSSPVEFVTEHLHIPSLLAANNPFSRLLQLIENSFQSLIKSLGDLLLQLFQYIESLIVRIDSALFDYFTKLLQILFSELSSIYYKIEPKLEQLFDFLLSWIVKFLAILFRMFLHIVEKIFEVILTPSPYSSALITSLITFAVSYLFMSLYQSISMSLSLFFLICYSESNFSLFNFTTQTWHQILNKTHPNDVLSLYASLNSANRS